MGAMTGVDLTEGAQVALELGGSGGPIDCTIFAFVGPVILVLPQRPPSPSAIERMVAGEEAYLLIERAGRLLALRGSVTLAGDALAVRVTDEFRLGQRRAWSRAPLRLRAQLRPLGGPEGSYETFTVDVSPGGVQIERPAGMPVWPRYELSLALDGSEQSITAEVVPVRAQADVVSLRFTQIRIADRKQLVQIVLECLRAVSAAT
jgi:hypothetical protein